MKIVVDYCVVEQNTKEWLVSDVKKLIVEGWQPQGGVFWAGDYAQAMVRFEAVDRWHADSESC